MGNCTVVNPAGVGDLAAAVREQVVAQQAVASGRTIHLQLPDQAVPVLVMGDADRLAEVLANYLTNAFKYSASDRSVEVQLEVSEGLAVVSVHDEGPRPPPEERDRVWELFHRVPGVEVQSTTASGVGSLGLGLHICKRLVELHPPGAGWGWRA